jgi:hypothetical protein
MRSESSFRKSTTYAKVECPSRHLSFSREMGLLEMQVDSVTHRDDVS